MEYFHNSKGPMDVVTCCYQLDQSAVKVCVQANTNVITTLPHPTPPHPTSAVAWKSVCNLITAHPTPPQPTPTPSCLSEQECY